MVIHLGQYPELADRIFEVSENVTDIPQALAYKPSIQRSEYLDNIHKGQRKLLVSEVKFLSQTNTQSLVVYVGAAPNNKLGILMKMFPHLTFLLIDPRETYVRVNGRNHYGDKRFAYLEYASNRNVDVNYIDGTRVVRNKMDGASTPVDQAKIDYVFRGDGVTRVYICESFFDDDFARMLRTAMDATGNSIRFISDIRTADDGKPSETAVMRNNIQNFVWCKIIEPEYSLLKFRTPYIGMKIDWNSIDSAHYGVDFRSYETTGSVPYFKMELQLQAHAGKSSTEVRGFLTRDDLGTIVEYSALEHEQKMYFYNKVQRLSRSKNPLWMIDQKRCKELGIDLCGDCCIEATAVLRFSRISGISPFRVIEGFGGCLKAHGHGRLF